MTHQEVPGDPGVVEGTELQDHAEVVRQLGPDLEWHAGAAEGLDELDERYAPPSGVPMGGVGEMQGAGPGDVKGVDVFALQVG